MYQLKSDGGFTSAFQQLCETWGSLPEVTGVDIGYRPVAGLKHSLCFRIHLAKPADRLWLEKQQPLAREIQGLPVSVVIGRYQEQMPPVKSPTLVNKCSIENNGLGYALSGYLSHQHPLTGRCHRLLASYESNADILAPSGDNTEQPLLTLISELEQKLTLNPKAPASVVCYQPGALCEDKINLYLRNLPPSHTNHKYRLDGIGLYRCHGNYQLHAGIRVRPLAN